MTERHDYSFGTNFVASPHVVAFTREFSFQPDPASDECCDAAVVAGSPQGPLRVLGPRFPETAEALDVGGSRIAYLVGGRRGRRLVVWDLARRHSRPWRVLHGAAFGDTVRIAGRFVAWRTPAGAVVVYDLRRRRIRYRTIPSRVQRFALQSDGKVAATISEIPNDAAYWFSARGVPHRLHEASPRSEVRIAGDHVAYVRATRGAHSALVVDDLAGGEQRVRELAAADQLHGFDFDGSRIAWAVQHVVRVERLHCRDVCFRYVGPSALYVARVPR